MRRTAGEASSFPGAPSGRTDGWGFARVLPGHAGSGQGSGTVRGRMETVRTHGLARKQQLLEPGSLVLGPGPGAVPGRREPLGVPIARSRSAALERTGRENVVSD